MRGAILLVPQYVFIAWCLVKHRDNFNFIINEQLCLLASRRVPCESDRGQKIIIREILHFKNYFNTC
jgi:hypothetical protein